MCVITDIRVQLFWIANAVFTMSNALVKLSLLTQYLRFFEVPSMRIACKGLIILISIWGSIYSFIAWFPVSSSIADLCTVWYLGTY